LLLSNVCVVTSFYQSLQAMSSFMRFSICAIYCTLSQSEAFFWTITKILVSAQEPKIKSAQSKFSAAQSKCQWQAKDVMIMRF